MFIRRFFYNKLTGNTLYSYMMQGDITIPSIEQDISTYQSLQNVSAEVIGYVEWREPDLILEGNFTTATSERYDLATNEIVFDMTPIPPIEPVIPPTESELINQELVVQGQIITDLELNQIEQGQQITDLELSILGGQKNV